MPCASKPVRSASIIFFAAVCASAGGTPQAINASRENATIDAMVKRLIGHEGYAAAARAP